MSMDLSRRALLGLGAVSLVNPAVALNRIPTNWKGKKPKNIIFCVADGMAIQVPSMVDYFTQVTQGHRSYLATLMEEDYAVLAFQETRSLSSIVTDSSAAASTWGSGRRIWNGMTNMYPDKTKLRTLTDVMSSAGVKCGLVTTTTATHATPSGFAVCSISRSLEEEIALSYLTSGVDVLMGGGDKFFNPEKRKDKVDAYAKFRAAGFHVVKNREQLSSVEKGKVLGIYSDSHVPYTVDRNNSEELTRTVPPLADMVKTAIKCLNTGSNGFLLQIEGGKVDHAAHANDVAGMINEQIDFEAAVKVAIDFALKDGETLVIITADHSTGGPSLNGDGTEYFDSTAGLASVGNMKASVTNVIDKFGTTTDRSTVQDVVQSKLGIKLTTEDADGIVAIHNGDKPFKLARFLNWKGGGIGAILGNYCKVTWTSGNHTCDHVLVTSIGPGSEKVHGIIPNHTFFDIMLDMKGLSWSNPKMTFEEAQRHMKNLKEEKDGDLPLFAEEDTPHGASHLGLL